MMRRTMILPFVFVSFILTRLEAAKPSWILTVTSGTGKCAAAGSKWLSCWSDEATAANDDLMVTATGTDISYSSIDVFYENGAGLDKAVPALSFDLDTTQSRVLIGGLGKDVQITATKVQFAEYKTDTKATGDCTLVLHVLELTSAEKINTKAYFGSDLGADQLSAPLQLTGTTFDLNLKVKDTVLKPAKSGYRFILVPKKGSTKECLVKLNEGFTEARKGSKPVVYLKVHSPKLASEPSANVDKWNQGQTSVSVANCQKPCGTITPDGLNTQFKTCADANTDASGMCLATIVKNVESTALYKSVGRAAVAKPPRIAHYVSMFKLGKAGGNSINTPVLKGTAYSADSSPWMVSQVSFLDSPGAGELYKNFQLCQVDGKNAGNEVPPTCPTNANPLRVETPKDPSTDLHLVPQLTKFPLPTRDETIDLVVLPSDSNIVSAVSRGRKPSVQLISFSRPGHTLDLKNTFKVTPNEWTPPTTYNLTYEGTDCNEVAAKGLSLKLAKEALNKLDFTTCNVEVVTSVKRAEERDGVYVSLTDSLADLADQSNLGLVAGVGYKMADLGLGGVVLLRSVKFKAEPIVDNPALYLLTETLSTNPQLGELPVVITQTVPLRGERSENLETNEVRYDLTEPVVLSFEQELNLVEFPQRDVLGKVPFAPTLRTLGVKDVELTFKTAIINPDYTYKSPENGWTRFEYSVTVKGKDCLPDPRRLCLDSSIPTACVSQVLPKNGVCEVEVKAYTRKERAYRSTTLVKNEWVSSPALILPKDLPQAVYGQTFKLSNVKFNTKFEGKETLCPKTKADVDLRLGVPNSDAAAFPDGSTVVTSTGVGVSEFKLSTSVASSSVLAVVPKGFATIGSLCDADVVFPQLEYSVTITPAHIPTFTIQYNIIPDSCETQKPPCGGPLQSKRMVEICLSRMRKNGCKAKVTEKIDDLKLNVVVLDKDNKIPSFTLKPGIIGFEGKSSSLVGVTLKTAMSSCGTVKFSLMKLDSISNFVSTVDMKELEKVGDFANLVDAQKPPAFTLKAVITDSTLTQYFVVPEAGKKCNFPETNDRGNIALEIDVGDYKPMGTFNDAANAPLEESIKLIAGAKCDEPIRKNVFLETYSKLKDVEDLLKLYPECSLSIVRKLSMTSVKVPATKKLGSLQFTMPDTIFSATVEGFKEFQVTSIKLGPGVADKDLSLCLKDPIVTTVVAVGEARNVRNGVQFGGKYEDDQPFQQSKEEGVGLGEASLSTTKNKKVVRMMFGCDKLEEADLSLESLEVTLEAKVSPKTPTVDELTTDKKFSSIVRVQQFGENCDSAGTRLFKNEKEATDSVLAYVTEYDGTKGCTYMVEVEVRSHGLVKRLKNGYAFRLPVLLEGHDNKLKHITVAGGIGKPDCEEYDLVVGDSFDQLNLVTKPPPPRIQKIGPKKIISNNPYILDSTKIFDSGKQFVGIVQSLTPTAACGDSTAQEGQVSVASTGSDSLVYTIQRKQLLPPVAPTTKPSEKFNLDKVTACGNSECLKKTFSTEKDLLDCTASIKGVDCSYVAQKTITVSTTMTNSDLPQTKTKRIYVKLDSALFKQVLTLGQLSKGQEWSLTKVTVSTGFPTACGTVTLMQSLDKGEHWTNISSVIPTAVAEKDLWIASSAEKVDALCTLPNVDFTLILATKELPQRLITLVDPNPTWGYKITTTACQDVSAIPACVKFALSKTTPNPPVAPAPAPAPVGPTLDELNKCLPELEKKKGCTVSVEAEFQGASGVANLDTGAATTPVIVETPVIVLKVPEVNGISFTVSSAVFPDNTGNCGKETRRVQVLSDRTSLLSSSTERSEVLPSKKLLTPPKLVAVFPEVTAAATCTFAPGVGKVTLKSDGIQGTSSTAWASRNLWKPSFTITVDTGSSCGALVDKCKNVMEERDLEGCFKSIAKKGCFVTVKALYKDVATGNAAVYIPTPPKLLNDNLLKLLDVKFTNGSSSSVCEKEFMFGTLTAEEFNGVNAPTPVLTPLQGETTKKDKIDLRIETIQNSKVLTSPFFVSVGCEYSGVVPEVVLVATKVNVEPVKPVFPTITTTTAITATTRSAACKKVNTACATTQTLEKMVSCLDSARADGCSYDATATVTSKPSFDSSLLQTQTVVAATLLGVTSLAISGGQQWIITGVTVNNLKTEEGKCSKFTLKHFPAETIDYLESHPVPPEGVVVVSKDVTATGNEFKISGEVAVSLESPGKNVILVLEKIAGCAVPGLVDISVSLKAKIDLRLLNAFTAASSFVTTYSVTLDKCAGGTPKVCTGEVSDLEACLEAVRNVITDPCKANVTQTKTASFEKVYVVKNSPVLVSKADSTHKFNVTSVNLQVKPDAPNANTCKVKYWLRPDVANEDEAVTTTGAVAISDEALSLEFKAIELNPPKLVTGTFSVFLVSGTECKTWKMNGKPTIISKATVEIGSIIDGTSQKDKWGETYVINLSTQCATSCNSKALSDLKLCLEKHPHKGCTGTIQKIITAPKRYTDMKDKVEAIFVLGNITGGDFVSKPFQNQNWSITTIKDGLPKACTTLTPIDYLGSAIANPEAVEILEGGKLAKPVKIPADKVVAFKLACSDVKIKPVITLEMVAKFETMRFPKSDISRTNISVSECLIAAGTPEYAACILKGEDSVPSVFIYTLKPLMIEPLKIDGTPETFKGPLFSFAVTHEMGQEEPTPTPPTTVGTQGTPATTPATTPAGTEAVKSKATSAAVTPAPSTVQTVVAPAMARRFLRLLEGSTSTVKVTNVLFNTTNLAADCVVNVVKVAIDTTKGILTDDTTGDASTLGKLGVAMDYGTMSNLALDKFLEWMFTLKTTGEKCPSFTEETTVTVAITFAKLTVTDPTSTPEESSVKTTAPKSSRSKLALIPFLATAYLLF